MKSLEILKPIFFWISVIATFGGLLGYLTLVPKISLTPSQILNPRDPFRTPFILQNDGAFSIQDISTEIVLVSVKDSRNKSLSDIALRSSVNDSLKLTPSRQTSINISINQFISGLDIPYQQAIIQIDVGYKWLHFFRKKESVKFELNQINPDQPTWLPINH